MLSCLLVLPLTRTHLHTHELHIHTPKYTLTFSHVLTCRYARPHMHKCAHTHSHSPHTHTHAGTDASGLPNFLRSGFHKGKLPELNEN